MRDLGAHRSADVVTIDLSQVTFLRPAHLAGVAACAQRVTSRGHEFRLVGPAQRDASGYAARMHLGQILDAMGAEHDLPDPVERAHSGLLEVSVIDAAEQVRALASLVFGAVAPVDERLAAALHESLAELGANVEDHSGTIGFACAQIMPGLRELRFAVVDSGLGLRRTLAGKGATTDRVALRLALEGVSRFDDPDRGGGLRTTVELVSELSGSVFLASGAATARDSGSARSFSNSSPQFAGTLVEAIIPVGPGRHTRLLDDTVSAERPENEPQISG